MARAWAQAIGERPVLNADGSPAYATQDRYNFSDEKTGIRAGPFELYPSAAETAGTAQAGANTAAPSPPVAIVSEHVQASDPYATQLAQLPFLDLDPNVIFPSLSLQIATMKIIRYSCSMSGWSHASSF